MTIFAITRENKLPDEAEEFIRREWALLEGEQGAAMAAAKPIAVIAYRDGDIAGVAKGWCSGGIGYIAELMVAQQHRSAGLGRQLLHEAEAISRSAGARCMALRVESDSPAVDFYRREGWREELTVKDWLNGHDYLQLRKDL